MRFLHTRRLAVNLRELVPIRVYLRNGPRSGVDGVVRRQRILAGDAVVEAAQAKVLRSVFRGVREGESGSIGKVGGTGAGQKSLA